MGEPRDCTPPIPNYLADFRDLYGFFGYATEAKGILAAETVFLLFIRKPQDNGDSPDQGAEATVDEYLNHLPESMRDRINLVKCMVSEEDLHLVSLSRIYPWSLIERVNSLPSLIRLDGARFLHGPEISDFNKLDLTFKRLKKISSDPIEPLPVDIPSHRIVLTARPGLCAVHGRVLESLPPKSEARDVEYPPQVKGELKQERSTSVIWSEMLMFEVERRRKEEPAVEPAQPAPPPSKAKGKGKKKKGKNQKGKKGKGKKGKGKKK